MFDTQKFQECLNTQWLGQDFVYIEKAESTNLLLKQTPDRELTHGTVLLADTQLSGRGQYGRTWESEPGKNLTFTMAFKPAETTRLPYLTVVSVWAVSQALSSIYSNEFCVKWPNDLIADGKKIGGLLTESVFVGQCLNRVLVGVGLNTGQTQFSEEIMSTATSLALLSGSEPQREPLLAAILKQIESAYNKWQRYDDTLQCDVNRSLNGYGEWVKLSVDGIELKDRVKFLGINEKGQLVILTQEFEVTTFSYEQIKIHPVDPSGEGLS